MHPSDFPQNQWVTHRLGSSCFLTVAVKTKEPAVGGGCPARLETQPLHPVSMVHASGKQMLCF